ncbi:MAG: hypothetical protein IJ781_02295 [Atopobiaceae bacterium]|nr:hypothetical protein [Atopobiaceae bacterium]
MGLIYKTNSWKGYGKQNTYHNEYFDDGDIIRKVKVHLFKLFDGRENSWEREEKVEEAWARDDPNMPDWLRKLLG